MMTTNAEVMDALVAQKGMLLELVGCCDRADDFERLLEMVKMAAPLWAAEGYAYKTREVVERAIDAAWATHGRLSPHAEQSQRKALRAFKTAAEDFLNNTDEAARAKSEHYGRLNDRFESRAVRLKQLGFRRVQIDEYDTAVYARPRPGKKIPVTVPASFVMHADEVCWADRVEELSR